MCRLFAASSTRPVALDGWVKAFSDACEQSKEYQGHGWGAAWREDGRWRRYRSIEPIWTSDFVLPETTLAVVHARSAFRNEGIVVENNMPFLDDELAFAFNGELRGVRLRVPGETGAARLHHLLDRFRRAADGDLVASLQRLDEVIMSRSDYVRALNIVVSDGEEICVHTRYSEDPDYFTLWQAVTPDLRMVCSERIDGPDVVPAWTALENGLSLRLGDGAPC